MRALTLPVAVRGRALATPRRPDVLPPQVAMSRHRGDKPPRRAGIFAVDGFNKAPPSDKVAHPLLKHDVGTLAGKELARLDGVLCDIPHLARLDLDGVEARPHPRLQHNGHINSLVRPPHTCMILGVRVCRNVSLYVLLL